MMDYYLKLLYNPIKHYKRDQLNTFSDSQNSNKIIDSHALASIQSSKLTKRYVRHEAEIERAKFDENSIDIHNFEVDDDDLHRSNKPYQSKLKSDPVS